MTYPNGVITSYSYDTASRLTNILHQGPSALIESLTYTYDAAGNRISFDRTNGTATLLPDAVQAAYDAANEQIQFNNATPNLTYDANGSLTSRTDMNGTTTYTWDARNRLTAINGPGVSANFVYDPLGRRVSKTVNGSTTQYFYDGNDIVQEIGSGAVAVTYLRSLNIDEPFIRQANTNEYYQIDALGSVLALTDQTGVVQAIYRYDPFGNTGITGLSTNPFQYTGRENDGTGLYFYRARYYSPGLQRFISEDPIHLLGGINFYSYAGNSPSNFNDPHGLVDPATVLGLTIVGLVGVEVVLNTEVKVDSQGDITVTIPPPSTFEIGVPLPVPFGLEIDVEIVDVPIIGDVTVPTDLRILIDPNFVPSPPSAEAAEPPRVPSEPGGGPGGQGIGGTVGGTIGSGDSGGGGVAGAKDLSGRK